jgi:regulator of replication initiation timing
MPEPRDDVELLIQYLHTIATLQADLNTEVEELKREQARLHGEIMALEDEVQFHQVGDGYEAGRAHSEQAHMAEITRLRACLDQIAQEGHHYCRWGHGPSDDQDKRRGDELCSCGKVHRDALIREARRHVP